MRSLLGAILAACALSTAAAECPLDSIADIAQYIVCDDYSVVQACQVATQSHDGLTVDRLDSIIPCLKVNGCTGTEALVVMCQDKKVRGPEELRRRQNGFTDATDSDNNDDDDESTTADPTATDNDNNATPTANTEVDTKTADTTKDDKTTAAAETTKDDKTTEAAETTAAATTADDKDTTATPDPTTTTDTTASPTTATTPTPTSSTTDTTVSAAEVTQTPGKAPLVCLTTSMVSTSFCPITTINGARTSLPCTPTTSPSVACAPGLLCQTQAAGNTSCMVKQDKLTTSGLIVTLVFSGTLAVVIGSIIFMCCKNRREARREEMRAQSALLASTRSRGQRDLEASQAYNNGGGQGRHTGGNGPAGSDAHLPLMSQPGPAGPDTGYMGAGRPTAHRVPSGGVSPMENSDDIGYGRQS